MRMIEDATMQSQNQSSANKTLSQRNKKILCWMLYFSGFLDLCGVGMIIALIPSRARDSGASTTLTGLLGSVYGGVQLLSSPVMGKWADGVSRKTSILLTLGFTAIGYMVMGFSANIFVLLGARIILGLFKHTQTMNKAYLADVVTEKERSSVFGQFNSFSSIGFIVGPMVGGHLAETSLGFSLVATVTATCFILNTAFMWWFLPHHNQPKHGKSLEKKGEPSKSKGDKTSDSTFSSSFILFAFWDLFLIIFFGSFSVIVYRSNFSLLLKEKFLASPKTMGYITSYTGLVSTLCGFTVGSITQRYKNNHAKLFLHATIAEVFVFVCLSVAPSIPVLIAFLTPLSVITSVARVATTSLTIQRCGKEKMAAVMGWSQSVTSIARMMAPLMAGVAQEWSMDAACYMSVVGVVASLVIMLLIPQQPSSSNVETLANKGD